MSSLQALARRPITGVAAYCAVAVVGAVAAYYALFSTFAPYDDEGYVLVSLSNFIDGGALYDQVYSQYGPLYHQIFGALFGATGLDTTSTNARYVVLVLWLALATGYGVLAERITGARWIGVAAQIVAFGVLGFMTAEPMHPIGLTTTLVLALFVTALWTRNESRNAYIALGVAAGALAMVKINMGALAAVGVLAAGLLTLTPPRHRHAARVAAVVLLALAPLALLAGNLDEMWVQRLLAVELAGLAAVVVTVWASHDGNGGFGRALKLTLAGAFAVVLGSSLIAIVLGTSPVDLIDGVLIEPTRHPSVILVPTALPGAVIGWGAAAIGAALVTTLVRTSGLAAAPLPRALVRVFAALVVVFSISRISPLSANPASGPLPLAVLLAWIAARPPRGIDETPAYCFARVAIVLVALLEILQAYPIGFSRVDAGALSFVAIAALLTADALRLFGSWRESAAAGHRANAGAIGAVALAAVIANFAVTELARPLSDNHRRYADNPALGLAGAEKLHIDKTATAAYRTLSAATAGCDSLITVTGFYSFNIWTQIPTSTGQVANDWPALLSHDRQQEVVDEIKDRPGLCVIRNEGSVRVGAANSKAGEKAGGPLLDYLNSTPLEIVASADIGQPDGTFTVQRRPGAGE